MNGHTPFAGNVDLGSYQPVHLFAGSADIVTDRFPVGADLAQYQVFAVNSAGKAVPHDPTKSDGTEKAVGITLFAVTLSAGGNEHARLALLLPQWPPPAAPPTTPTSCRNSFRPSPPVIVFSTMR